MAMVKKSGEGPLGVAPTPAKPKLRRSRLIRIGGSALMLTLLLTYLPSHQVWSTIKRVPPSLAVGMVCMYLAVHLVGVVKWRLLINLAGANLTFAQSVRCYYGGLFGNIFLPSLVGGDLVRAGMAFMFSRSKEAIILGSLMDRVQDVASTACVAAVGVLLLPKSLDYQSHRVFWTVFTLLALGGAAGVVSVVMLPARKFPMKVQRIMARFRCGVRSLYRRPRRMFFCFSLGILLQISQVVINYRLGKASGVNVAFGVWLFAWPLAKLWALLPITQGGIGIRETALVALMVPFGAPPVLTAAAGLVYQAVVISGGVAGGATALVIGRIFSKRHGAPPPMVYEPVKRAAAGG